MAERIDPATIGNEVSTAIEEMIAPLRAQLARVEEAIAEAEAEVRQLRATRIKIVGVIARVDPTQAVRGRRKNEGAVGRLKAGQAMVERIDGWLHEHLENGQAFTGPELFRMGFDLCSDATLSAALNQLRDAGRIRLDHLGGENLPPNTRWFKLAT